MARNLPAPFVAALTSDVINIAYFVEIDYFEGPSRAWNGLGSITVDGKEWFGVGSLGQIELFEQTREIRSSGFILTLSGVSPTAPALLLQSRGKGRGRPFAMYIAAMNDDFTSVLEDGGTEAIYKIAGGIVDESRIEEDETDTRLVVRVENEMVTLFRPNHTRYTDEDQRRIHPEDNFFRYTAGLSGKIIQWGVPGAAATEYVAEAGRIVRRLRFPI